MSRNNSGSAGTKKLFENRLFLFAFSLLFSIVVWAVVSSTQTTTDVRTLTGIPVQIQLSDSFVNETGLQLYGEHDFTVDVTVSGASYIINKGSFTADDITVTASLDAVASPGSYNLPVSAKVKSEDITVEKVSASFVTAYFDECVTKTFEVTEKVEHGSNYSLAPGFILENPTLSKDTIELRGPLKEISRITAVTAVATIDTEVKSTEKYVAEIVFETEDDEFDKTNIEILTEGSYYVTLPVSQSGTYDVKIEFTNIPKDMREDGIKYSVSPSTIDLTINSAATGAMINDDGTITVGTVDFSKINNEYNVIKVTDDSLGEETVFTVKIDMSGMEKQWREVNVDTTNVEIPSNVKINTTSIKSVQIVGPKTSVNNSLSYSEAYAVPVLENVDLTAPGTYTVPAKIVFRTLTDAWVFKTYQIEITVS